MPHRPPRPFPSLEFLAQTFGLLGAVLVLGGVYFVMLSINNLRISIALIDASPIASAAQKSFAIAGSIWEALMPLLAGLCLLALSSTLRVVREVGVHYYQANLRG